MQQKKMQGHHEYVEKPIAVQITTQHISQNRSVIVRNAKNSEGQITMWMSQNQTQLAQNNNRIINIEQKQIECNQNRSPRKTA